jgi:hypothetical protein
VLGSATQQETLNIIVKTEASKEPQRLSCHVLQSKAVQMGGFERCVDLFEESGACLKKVGFDDQVG